MADDVKGVREVFIDGVKSVGSHNGVVRVEFFSLSPDGSAKPAILLLLPQSQLRSVVDGLTKSLR